VEFRHEQNFKEPDMEQTQAIGAGLTFEKVWAALMENREQIKATSEQIKDTDRQMKATSEQMKATNDEVREQIKATDRQIEATSKQIKDTGKKVGELTNRFGDVVEYMVLPNLVLRFEELGFTFTKANRTRINDKEHDLSLEVDALLENGDKVMAVEIKTTPKDDDIDDHIERMEKLRRYADLHDDKRVYFGAVAGVVFTGSRKRYALKQGFYVIEPSGDTFKITEPKGAYRPCEW
jgi:hypothetical protein